MRGIINLYLCAHRSRYFSYVFYPSVGICLSEISLRRSSTYGNDITNRLYFLKPLPFVRKYCP